MTLKPHLENVLLMEMLVCILHHIRKRQGLLSKPVLPRIVRHSQLMEPSLLCTHLILLQLHLMLWRSSGSHGGHWKKQHLARLMTLPGTHRSVTDQKLNFLLLHELYNLVLCSGQKPRFAGVALLVDCVYVMSLLHRIAVE